MFFKKRKLMESNMQQLHGLLKASFTNVKRDTQLIFQWLNFFHQKTQQQDALIRDLKDQISELPKTRGQIKGIIDEFYNYKEINRRIYEMDARISAYQIQPIQKSDEPRLEEIKKRLENLEQKRPSLKEKLIKKITKSSKEYVKSILISYIKKYEKISALQLKEMIVDEQGICSKSSFYRILEEIEAEEDISIVKAGKEKHYLFKIPRRL